jgi:S1-C subfamily serine protease
MRGLFSVLMAVALVTTPALAAQRNAKKPEAPPPPPPFHVTEPTRSMTAARVELEIPAHTQVGELAQGVLGLDACVKINHDHPVNVDEMFSAPRKDYISAFNAEAQAAGYNVSGFGAGANLFGAENQQPEIQIGGAITAITVSGCVDERDIDARYYKYVYKIDATIAVDWQVFDPLEKKLLFRRTTQGHAISKEEHAHTQAALAAFQDAAKAVLADPAFLAAVRDPNGKPPSNNGLLFPEASTQAPQGTAETRQIARVPLATTAFADQLKAIHGQVVTVLTPGGSGSGFYVADGLLITNHHVIAGYTNVKIRFMGGHEIDGEVLSSDARRDVALIKTDSINVSGLPLQLKPPVETAKVFVIGSPLGEANEGSVSSGIVSAFRKHKQGPFIQSDVQVTHGNSGGPMFDENGNVIAITDIGVLADDGSQTFINLFIPIADALRALKITVADAATADANHP